MAQMKWARNNMEYSIDIIYAYSVFDGKDVFEG